MFSSEIPSRSRHAKIVEVLVGASLFASNIGSGHFVGLAGWNMYVAVIALVALAAIFTISGGLSAVIWTDFIQTIIMIIAAFVLMIICYVKVGGIQIIKEMYPYAVSSSTLYNVTSCGMPPNDYFSLIRPLNSGNGPPWVGIIGLRGLMLACMIAALMSSLTSIFNSSSTIFTIDIWQRFRQKAPQWELLIVGRVFILVLVGISIIWIPIISAFQGGKLFDYIHYLTKPIPDECVSGKSLSGSGASSGIAVAGFELTV
ncbi:unnamed protein product, partial [Didymodactylos carnosus]